MSCRRRGGRAVTVAVRPAGSADCSPPSWHDELRLLDSTPLACAVAEGMPIIWGLANPKIGERDATRALHAHDRHLTTG